MCECEEEECNGCTENYFAIVKKFELLPAFITLFNVPIPNIYLSENNNGYRVVNINFLQSVFFLN